MSWRKLLHWLSRNKTKAPAVLNLNAPASPIMKMADGSDYDPPPEVSQAIALLMSLSLEEYMRACVYLCPFEWHFQMLETLNNPLAQTLFARICRERYFRYHAHLAAPASNQTPPSTRKNGGSIQ